MMHTHCLLISDVGFIKGCASREFEAGYLGVAIRYLDALLVGEERLLDAVEGVHQTLLHGVDGILLGDAPTGRTTGDDGGDDHGHAVQESEAALFAASFLFLFSNILASLALFWHGAA